MRFRTLTAVAALALAGTAACDLFNPDPRPSLAVSIATDDAVVGEPVLMIVQLADEGGLRTLTVDWGDATVEEMFDLTGPPRRSTSSTSSTPRGGSRSR